MKPKNTKRNSMRSGSVLAGKNSPNPISVLVDPPGLGIGRVGGGVFWNQVWESSEDDKKRLQVNHVELVNL